MMVEIDSLDDPRITEYRFLPEKTGRLLPGERTIVESELVAMRLLRQPWAHGRVESALLETSAAERLAPLLVAQGVPHERIFVAPKAVLERIVGYHLHQGVFVSLRVPSYGQLDDLLLPAVLLVGVSSATNVGAIARSCAAFGIGSLVCDRGSASPWLRRSIRVSMGAVFALRTYNPTEPTDELIARLRRRGARLVGIEVGAPIPYTDFEWSSRDVLVFGSEGKGIDRSLMEMLDAGVRIPITAAIDSLNVSAAAAIVLAECARQCALVVENRS